MKKSNTKLDNTDGLFPDEKDIQTRKPLLEQALKDLIKLQKLKGKIMKKTDSKDNLTPSQHIDKHIKRT